VFSVQADPMYCTFEGVDDGSLFSDVIYQLVIDFDAPTKINNSYVMKDYYNASFLHDFGSVIMDATSESLYFPVNVDYNTAMSYRVYNDIISLDEIILMEYETDYFSSSLMLVGSLDSDFEINHLFRAYEYSSNSVNGLVQEAAGVVQITNVSSVSVDEPEIIVMLFGSLIFLVGFQLVTQKPQHTFNPIVLKRGA